MSGEEVANLRVQAGEDPFGEWLGGEVCKRVDMKSDTRLQLLHADPAVDEPFWPKTLPQYRQAGYPLNEVPLGIPDDISLKEAMKEVCMAGYPATEVEELLPYHPAQVMAFNPCQIAHRHIVNFIVGCLFKFLVTCTSKTNKLSTSTCIVYVA